MQAIIQINRFELAELSKLTEALSQNDIAFRWATSEDLFDPTKIVRGIIPNGLIFCSVDNYITWRESNRQFKAMSNYFWNGGIFDRQFVNKLLSNSQIHCVNNDGVLVESMALLNHTNGETVCFTNSPTKTAFTGGVKVTSSLIKSVNIPSELHRSKFWVVPKRIIEDEARFFVVNHEVVDGSYYRYLGNFIGTANFVSGKKVDLFARTAAKQVVRALKEIAPPNYVVDVARLKGETTWRFLETNALPCSAFYDCDYVKVINKLKEWAT